MGCRILDATMDADITAAVFYCSATMKAFGPVMGSVDEAEAFLKFIPGDPRNLDDKKLFAKYAEFVNLFVCKCGMVRSETCDWCDNDINADKAPLGTDGKHHSAALSLDQCPKSKNEKCSDGDAGLCCGGGYDSKLKRNVSCDCSSCHPMTYVCEKEAAPENGERYVCASCRLRIKQGRLR